MAARLGEFPRCAESMREGRLSLDQVGVIAARAGRGIRCPLRATGAQRLSQPTAHRGQAGTATRNPILGPNRKPSITKSTDDEFTCWRIKLPHADAAKFDAALQSHHEALIAEWKRDHDNAHPRIRPQPPDPGHR